MIILNSNNTYAYTQIITTYKYIVQPPYPKPKTLLTGGRLTPSSLVACQPSPPIQHSSHVAILPLGCTSCLHLPSCYSWLPYTTAVRLFQKTNCKFVAM